MSGDVLQPLIAQLRQAGEADGLSDARLLERYVACRDAAAFELLVWRHGGLVLGAARRVLGHHDDADDAFQAAFLTLARKAAAVRRGEALAAWLHQVVCRIALRQRKRRARRWLVERPLDGIEIGRDSPAPDNLGPVLDAEVARLPEKYRRVVILCYLQGSTVADAARTLGLPRGTVLSRLSAARALLKRRLIRRGVAPAALAVLTAESANAAPSAALVSAAARLGGLPGDISSQVALMSNGVVQAMFWKKCQIVLVLLAVAAVGGVSVGRADRPGGGDEPPPAKPAGSKAEKQKPQKPAEAPEEVAPKVPLEIGRSELYIRKAQEQLEEQFARQRSDVRSQTIAIEEKFREVEFRQAWQREQQRRAIQNLDTTLHDRISRKKTAEAGLLNLQAELERTAQRVQANVVDKDSAMLLRQKFDNEARLIKGLEDEIVSLQRQLEKHTAEAAASEETRTAERVRVRQALAELEDRASGLERTQARQRDEVIAQFAAAAAAHGLIPPEPAPADARRREQERKLDEMQRELSELRRELKRAAKPE